MLLKECNDEALCNNPQAEKFFDRVSAEYQAVALVRERFPKCGHVVNIEQAEAFRQAMRRGCEALGLTLPPDALATLQAAPVM